MTTMSNLGLNYAGENTEAKKEVSLAHPFDDLFVWAVLSKRHALALLLWRHGQGIFSIFLNSRATTSATIIIIVVIIRRFDQVPDCHKIKQVYFGTTCREIKPKSCCRFSKLRYRLGKYFLYALLYVLHYRLVNNIKDLINS